MSSLLSTGVKKNKKSFAPTTARRKDRTKSTTTKSNVPDSLPPVPSLSQSTEQSQSSQTQSQPATQDVETTANIPTIVTMSSKRGLPLSTPAAPSRQILEPSLEPSTAVKVASTAKKVRIASLHETAPKSTTVEEGTRSNNTESDTFDDVVEMQDEEVHIMKVVSPKPTVEDDEKPVQIPLIVNSTTPAPTSVRSGELKSEDEDDSDNQGVSVIKVDGVAGVKRELQPLIPPGPSAVVEEPLTEEELALNRRNPPTVASSSSTSVRRARRGGRTSVSTRRRALERRITEDTDEEGDIDTVTEDNDEDGDYREGRNEEDEENEGAKSSAKHIEKRQKKKQRKAIARKPAVTKRPPVVETVEHPATRLRPRRAATANSGIPIVVASSSQAVDREDDISEAQSDSDEFSIGTDKSDDDTNEIDDLDSLSHNDELDTFLEQRKRRKGARKSKKKRTRRKKDDIPDIESLRTLEDLTNDETPIKKSHLERPMSYFTKDIDGVVSKTFKEMEIARLDELRKKEAYLTMSPEEVEELRKKEEEEKRLKEERKAAEKAAAEEERRKREAETPVLTESSNAVQVRIVNGEIVLDTDTLVVERDQGGHGGSLNGEAMEIVEESSMTRKVNSTTHGKRERSSKWDKLETETFYDLLSQFGTDFNTISKMMPRRTRNQIRSKFNREERVNPWKVTEYLVRKKKPVDLSQFTEVVGELDTVPEDFNSMELA